MGLGVFRFRIKFPRVDRIRSGIKTRIEYENCFCVGFAVILCLKLQISDTGKVTTHTIRGGNCDATISVYQQIQLFLISIVISTY